MQLLSINVGRPRLVQHRGATVSTAIYKEPVAGAVTVSELGIEGDDQADKSVHGGVDKAVYAYCEENYAWWRGQLDGRPLTPGTFGENLTIAGLPDTEVQIGDRYRVGTVLLEVTQPRQPCLKLGIKMGDPSFVKRFHHAELPGYYLRVVEPGTMETGSDIEVVERATDSLNVCQVYRLRFDPSTSSNQLRHAADLPGLSKTWQKSFIELAVARDGE